MLTFTDVDFGYKKKHRTIQGFTATFEAGKTLLLGPNGAGKSTLLALASGLLEPASGTINLEQKCVALMPQNVPAFQGLSVREQVAYYGWLNNSSMDHAWRRSENALAKVGLLYKANHKVRTLSGGQVRRLGIAMTILADAEVMLFDEPTAGLDIKEAANFYKVLAQTAGEDKCVIVSSHQIEGLSNFFDHVVLLVAGSINFSGSFKTFVELGYRLGASNQGEALVLAYSSFVEAE
jgi:ABC-2 type transport system ATP-binding protein